MCDRPTGKGAVAAGFTLLELMIVVTILGIVASIGVPQYNSALRVARVGKSRHDLVTISHLIDSYAASHEGHLPLTLHQIGYGGRRDPWGTPYCYLNYADGTGDGLEWAVAAGLVDPAAFISRGEPRPRDGGGGGPALGVVPAAVRRTMIAARAREAAAPQGPVVVEAEGPVGRDAVADANTLLRTVAEKVAREITLAETESFVSTARAGGVGMYAEVPVAVTRRRDQYMFPLNTDYDLFSLGPNAQTSVSLGEGVGLDDVIRANNGGFFGVAADY